jgi:Domain of unknown function (DUF4124)
LKPGYQYSFSAILLAIIATSSVGSAARTDYYRWLDSRGNPIHSDRPPPAGVDYEVVSTKSTFKRNVEAEEGAVPLETSPRVGNEFDQVDTEEAKRSLKNPELCTRAKDNLAALTNSEQVKVRNDQGEERFLTAEEIVVERQTAKAQLSVYCE